MRMSYNIVSVLLTLLGIVACNHVLTSTTGLDPDDVTTTDIVLVDNAWVAIDAEGDGVLPLLALVGAVVTGTNAAELSVIGRAIEDLQ